MKKEINALLACAASALMLASPAFGEDGYIESDGTQYINLGHFVGPNTKIALDFQMTEVGKVRMMGSVGDASNPRCRLYIGTNTSGIDKFSLTTSTSAGTEKGSNGTTSYPAGLERQTAVIDFAATTRQFQILDKDGALLDYGNFDSFPDGTSTYPLALFAENRAKGGIYAEVSGSTFYAPAKMKAYGVKIYEGGVEVKNFVPCVKGGVAGLKETHSGLFHTCEDLLSHPLAYGGDILTEKDDPYIWSPRNRLAPNDSAHLAGYENNIFLDTGYNITHTTRIELDYAMLTNFNASLPWASGEITYLISAQAYNSDKSKSQATAFAATTDGTMQYRIGSSSFATISACPVSTAHGIRRTVSLDSNSVALVTAGYTNFTGRVSAANVFRPDCNYPNRTLKIGAAFAGQGYYSPMKIYGLKIYESGTLVKDYVPFVENGVGGLKNSFDASDTLFSRTRLYYKDTFSDGAKTNIVFDVGGDIQCADREGEAYLEFTGVNGNCVNTGYVVTKDTCIEIDYQLWNTKHNGQQFLFEQRDGTTKKGMWARVYYGGSESDYTAKLSYSMCDNDNGTFHAKATTIGISNHRQTLTLDSYNGLIKVVRGDTTLYNKTFAQDGYNYTRSATTCVTNLWIGGNWSGLSSAASMRLYSFKISEAGKPKCNYVPCVRDGQAGLYDLEGDTFLPVAGGKVSGATLKGQAFQIAPKPAKLTHKTGSNSATLTCFAAGAQSYEWYVDGVRIEGEVSDSLTIAWTNKLPHVRTYSVRPVYTIFNERVVGEPAAAEVEFTPIGIAVSIQ